MHNLWDTFEILLKFVFCLFKLELIRQGQGYWDERILIGGLVG